MKPTTLGQIARILELTIPPQRTEQIITGINTLRDAQPTELSFLSTDRYLDDLRATRATVVLVQQRVHAPSDTDKLLLSVPDADLAVGRVLPLFAEPISRPAPGADKSARIDPAATIDPSCSIGPFVTVGPGCRIGPRCVLHAGVQISGDVVIGEDCELFANVVVRERVQIGRRVIINAGAVLGTDGFGFRWNGSAHEKIPQIGTVIVEDDVEIGSCVCIDRAKFAATVIGHGTKIDNLVQIGHNVIVGPHCIIAAQTGIAGSTRLGTGVVLGGQTGVRDHITIGDGAMAAACSAIADDIPPKTIVSGMPAMPHRQTLREQAALRRLPELVTEARKFKEQLTKLTSEQAP